MAFFRQFLSVAACSLLVVAAASAKQITYEVKGHLTEIRGSGTGLSDGEAFVARFTYDDQQADSGRLVEAGRQVYAAGQLLVQAAGATLSGTPVSEFQVLNNWSSPSGNYSHIDGVFVSAWSYDARGGSLMQFDLFDANGGLKLNSLALPTHAQLRDLASNGHLWIRRFDNGVETGLAQGSITQFSPVSSVPEPGQSLLLLTGLAAIAALRQKRNLFSVFRRNAA